VPLKNFISIERGDYRSLHALARYDEVDEDDEEYGSEEDSEELDEEGEYDESEEEEEVC